MVKLLISCGASPLDENKVTNCLDTFREKEEKSIFQVFLFQLGMTPVHIAARHGHSSVITEFVKQGISLRNLSRKTGMTVHDAEAKDDDSSTYSLYFTEI